MNCDMQETRGKHVLWHVRAHSKVT